MSEQVSAQVFETFNTIFPMCWLLSIRVCAAAVSANANSWSIIGAILPTLSSGQTCSRNCFAILA
jgi:hypothetical protein